jgi:hypothetical protein
MGSSKDAADDRRRQEIKDASFNYGAVLEVCETDADLIPGKVLHVGISRDVAETVMYNAFIESNCMADFLLFNHVTMENEALCLSDRTLARRGECQG